MCKLPGVEEDQRINYDQLSEFRSCGCLLIAFFGFLRSAADCADDQKNGNDNTGNKSGPFCFIVEARNIDIRRENTQEGLV